MSAFLLVWFGGLGRPALAQSNTDSNPPSEKVIEIRQALVLSRVSARGRRPIPIDPIALRIATDGPFRPEVGATAPKPNGEPATWEPIEANGNGQFRSRALRGAYLAAEVNSEADRVMILEASGHSMAWIGDRPRAGNPYGYGWHRVPIRLQAGTTPLLFAVGRGRLRVELRPPRAKAELNIDDRTLPDAVVGEPIDTWGSLVVLNATDQTADTLQLKVSCGAARAEVTEVPPLPPLSAGKVAFRLQAPAPTEDSALPVSVGLIEEQPDDSAESETMDQAQFDLRVRRPDQSRKRTFRSAIDGSVQYYAVQPATVKSEDDATTPPALVLTLHGASVEAIGQANAYQSKSWAHIVAPTNRRPYGFDWEDWGRLDALEVLEIAQERLQTDPSRTYLTGHSMGGHGAWHLGVTYPDHWAAIGPSAGWISMWSYAGAPERSSHAGPSALLTKARNPSDTMAMAHNLKRNGVYVLHGDQDDNVPVDQARQMRAELGSFHPDFVYYERPGAGHWWGNACVDWPPMFSFFQRHQQPNPEEVRQVDFQTASPGVSSRCDWVTIALQQRFLEPSRVQFTYDPDQTTIEGKTENVKRMALDLEQLQPEGSVTVRIDDEVLTIGQPKQIWLSRTANGWQLIDEPDPAAKGPHRYGTFKDAFRHRVQFVYGTQGTEAETAWALAKARFDAETFGYRGNGSIDIIPDTEFDPTADPDRNVVLYGHAEMNAAWKSLLNDSPVLIERGRLKVGDHERLRDDLGCLFLRPRQESDRASVGVVAGTGLTGLRLTDSLPVFVSGVAYPDLTVIGPDALRQGSEAVEATGYFGPDWSIENGAIGWSEP